MSLRRGEFLAILLLGRGLGGAPRAVPAARLIASAREQVGVTTSYDSAYRNMAYPNGDVPLHTGVCTDVLVRAYRKHGIDLQLEVHQDMRRAFAVYPRKWGLRAPDTNIDHRRVPNLQVFFRRQGVALPATRDANDYQPGDIVTWRLSHAPSGGVPHIGIVSDRRAGARLLILHNIGSGTQEEDILFDYPVTGRFRYALTPA